MASNLISMINISGNKEVAKYLEISLKSAISVIMFFFTSHILFSQDNHPTTGIPVIKGNFVKDGILEANLSEINDLDGIGTFKYQWYLDSTIIEDANLPTYRLSLSDLLHEISVNVEHTDQLNNIENIQSAPFGPWGEYQYLSDNIKNSKAATVRITASTAVMISPTHAITAAHSPLDANNEITPDLKVQNIFGEVRAITNVMYDLPSDFAIVELESPFNNSFSVKIAENDSSSGEPVYTIGNPKDTAWGGVGWAVSFGFARNILFEDYFKLFDIQTMGGYSGGGVFNDEGHLIGINSGSTSQFSEGSFRSGMVNMTGIFDEDFSILDGPWKMLNNYQDVAVSLSFIKDFLLNHNINNEVSNLNIDLPENKIDTYYDSLTEEEENVIHSIAKSVRKSIVGFSLDYSLSSGINPNGSGVLLTPRIVATNSHVVEGKEKLIITLYDGSEIKGSVLDHHGEMDVSFVLLDSPVTSIEPVKIASSRSVLGDKGFVIGHPFDLWRENGGWQVAAAISGYKTTQIDDRGDIVLEGGAESGMSGGPIFNSNAELIGINYAKGATISLELNDYQDPHSTYYNPIVSPSLIQVIGVDASGIRDLIDENSIFFDDQASPLSAFEKEYFVDQSENLFSIEKNNNTLSLSQLTNYEFKHLKNIESSIDSNLRWTILNVLSNDENEFYVINTYLNDYVPGINIIKLDGSLNIDYSFAESGYFTKTFDNLETQKVIKSKIYNGFLYVLTQDSRNQQISYSTHKIDLKNPESLVPVFSSINDINHNSHFFPKDFEVNENGFFIGGTTDYALQSIGQGDRSYDHFVSNYTLEGVLNLNFANEGVFQKDYGKTEKASDIIIQSDGKIIIAGMKWTDQAPDAIATRLNINGSIDSSFGHNGTTLICVDNDKTLGIDDYGREEANEILIDEDGSIYIAGTKYFGADFYLNELGASGGEYQSSIWKYDTNGNIIETFGDINFNNGSIPGLKSIEINGEDKIQHLMIVGGQIFAFISSRNSISKSTSAKVFIIDKQTGNAEIYADDNFTFFVPKNLVTLEDTPLNNIPIKLWLPPNKNYNLSISSPSGLIKDNHDLSFDYIPKKDFYGSDSIIVELEVDNKKSTETINVTVQALNDLPSIFGGNNIEIYEDNIAELKLYDPDGDDEILNYTIKSQEVDNGVIIDEGNLNFKYIPNKNFFGIDKFNISVEHLFNSQKLNGDFTVEINVIAVNDAPTVEDVSLSTELNTDGYFSFNGTDIEGDALTYIVVSNPENGSVRVVDNNRFVYTPNSNYLGNDTFKYKANDGSVDSNDEATVLINVVDTTVPVITLTGNATVTHEVKTTYIDAGATASDNYDGDITSSIAAVSTVDVDVVGTYTITYNVSDTSENTAATVSRTVNVVDTTVPVITLNGDATVTHEVGTAYTDAGATASDNYDGDISANIVNDVSTVNKDVLGSYKVLYNVTDANGNNAITVTRTINVVDTTVPVITLIGSTTLTHEVKTTYIDAGATASDNYDGDITSSIVTVNNVNTDTVGTYTITYNVSDTSGNNAVQVTRTINIESSLSVEENMKLILNIYPNPTKHSWKISTSEILESIELYDAIGRKVLSLNPKSKDFQINASSFSSGIYILVLNGKTVSRLIKN